MRREGDQSDELIFDGSRVWAVVQGKSLPAELKQGEAGSGLERGRWSRDSQPSFDVREQPSDHPSGGRNWRELFTSSAPSSRIAFPSAQYYWVFRTPSPSLRNAHPMACICAQEKRTAFPRRQRILHTGPKAVNRFSLPPSDHPCCSLRHT